MKPTNITLLLVAATEGDRGALELVMPMVYKELRRHAGYLMKAERAGCGLQPTDLVHEVFLRLVQLKQIQWTARTHFFAVASQFMRRILVEEARKRDTHKRGARAQRISLRDGLLQSAPEDVDVLAVDRAIEKLAALNPTHAEIVSMRFFGGLSVEEVAAVLGMPQRTVEARWTAIRAWLRRELAGSG